LAAGALDRGAIGRVDRQGVGVALSEQVRTLSQRWRLNQSVLF
jgi:hypothetical protein